MSLRNYRSLGKSGLLVSPFALGTMTFGSERWGANSRNAEALLDTYIEAGGNFLDTADIYASGRGEEMIGAYLSRTGMRDRVVLATKSGWSRSAETPLFAGNGAKNIRLALEQSLQRLGTDYIDLYWVHVWDQTTPAEEVLETLSGAVRVGKILHYGFSNAPAWYVAKIATLAQARGLPGPIALQYSYSLIDRAVELELTGLAREFGMGLVPWSPLAAGFLTGKYGRNKLAEAGRAPGLPNAAATSDSQESDGRLNGDSPVGGMLFTERNFDILDAVRAVAERTGHSPAEIALAWLRQRTSVASVLIGASRPEQLLQNIAALDVDLSQEDQAALDAVSALPMLNPYNLFSMPRAALFGQDVEPWKG